MESEEDEIKSKQASKKDRTLLRLEKIGAGQFVLKMCLRNNWMAYSKMNSNGCVQALIDLNRVRTSLQPFLSTASKQFLKEATNSILDLQEGNNF